MWTKYKKFVFRTYPKSAKWARGGGGGNKMEGIKSDPQSAENIKKGTESIVFWLFLNCQIALQTIPMGK
jgi:hypothetical protein